MVSLTEMFKVFKRSLPSIPLHHPALKKKDIMVYTIVVRT
jgi:hypothetical protein